MRRSTRSIRAALSATLAFGTACVSYEPLPQDPLLILRELADLPRPAPEGEGITVAEAAAFAVTHHPALLGLRAAVGVRKAELVEAGLLPEVEIGFDAMDALGAEIAGSTAKQEAFLAGLGVSWRVPRPGAFSARGGVARARRDEARQALLSAEWRLVRRVHLAFLGVLASKARLELNARVLDIARRNAEFFARALDAGAATAIQANLAAVELGTLVQDGVKLEQDLRAARRELDRLLGLAPTTEVVLAPGAEPFADPASRLDAESLTKRAVEARPDLKRLLARYEQAEAALRLEVAKQWPGLSIGTGVSIVLPLLSGFNRPAIRTAAARRDLVASELRAAVHALRAEVHDAVAALANARELVQGYEKDVLPRLTRSLELARAALSARRLTLVEALTAQRQVLDTSRKHLEAKIARARARALVDLAAGRIGGRAPEESPAPAEEEKR